MQVISNREKEYSEQRSWFVIPSSLHLYSASSYQQLCPSSSVRYSRSNHFQLLLQQISVVLTNKSYLAPSYSCFFLVSSYIIRNIIFLKRKKRPSYSWQKTAIAIAFLNIVSLSLFSSLYFTCYHSKRIHKQNRFQC